MNKKHMLPWYGLFGIILLTPLLILAVTSAAADCDNTNQNVQCVPLAQTTSVVSSTDTPTATLTITDTLTITATVTITATISDTSTITATATITPTATPIPSPTPKPTPKGDSPETARDPMWVKPQYCIEAMCPGATNAPPLNAPGNWAWIDANSSTWYKMDDGRSLQLDVWLFANGQKGLSFDVYAPEQKDLWGSKPIGRGSFDKSQANAGVDLFYTGRSVAYGVWYVKVNNGNSFPISYSLRFTRTTPTGLRNVCEGCHSGNMDWGSCQGSMCSDLHSLYDMNPQCYNHDASAQLADGGACQ